MVAETRLDAAHLIWPLFIGEGDGEPDPILTLPGVSRLSVNGIVRAAADAIALGIPAIALFPNTPSDRRTPDGAEGLSAANLVCRTVRAVRAAHGDAIGVITDVALDPYTSHGQDGLVGADGVVDNDATVALLARQAVVQADAGAQIVAPSDMMDGRVAAIRAALDGAGHAQVQIMSYAAKYASAFYGPFRDAVGSRGLLKGNKRGYQMDPANTAEALREVAMDIAEGADSVIVKPGMPYLDVCQRIADASPVPVYAYQVSGEYAMLEAAAAAGAGDRDAMVLEALLAFRRAGCAGVWTYHAPLAARLLA